MRIIADAIANPAITANTNSFVLRPMNNPVGFIESSFLGDWDAVVMVLFTDVPDGVTSVTVVIGVADAASEVGILQVRDSAGLFLVVLHLFLSVQVLV